MDQTTLCQVLIKASLRAYRINRIPATQKQCRNLAELIINANSGDDYVLKCTNPSFVLAESDASSIIEDYVNNNSIRTKND